MNSLTYMYIVIAAVLFGLFILFDEWFEMNLPGSFLFLFFFFFVSSSPLTRNYVILFT